MSVGRLFDGLTQHGRAALLEAMQPRVLPSNEALLTAGEANDSLFVVTRGALVVSLPFAEGALVVGTRPVGTWVGEVTLLEPGSATATVIAAEPCEVLGLTAPGLAELETRAPEVVAHVVRVLSEDLAQRVRAANVVLEGPPPERTGFLQNVFGRLFSQPAPQLAQQAAAPAPAPTKPPGRAVPPSGTATGLLRRFPEFARWSEAELSSLERYLTLQHVEPGHVFVHAGTANPNERALFAVLRGNVLVARGDKQFELGPGSLFGVVAFVDGGPRTASVIATGETEVLSLSADAASRLEAPLRARLEQLIARQLARDLASMNLRAIETWSSQAPPAPQARWATVNSYSGLHSVRTELHDVSTMRELIALFATARKQGRRVAIRGAGLSFDTQSISADLTVRLTGFDTIAIDREAQTVTAGAGATWGAVLAKTEPLGLVPRVVVSGSEITIGGTIALNALSRFSPVWGKEGNGVLSLEVLTVSGERLTLSRTKNAELFFATIGGFGQVTAVLSATYRLVSIGTPLRVASTVERSENPAGLADALACAPNPAPDAETAYAVIAFHGDKTRSMVTRSRYVAGLQLKQMLPHRPANLSRVPLELAIHHFHSMGQAFWNFAYDRYLEDGVTWVDELFGYTFFMDGNLRTQRAAGAMGLGFRTVQQTWVLPTRESLAPFIARARARTIAVGLELALVDVIYLSPDEPFALSSSNGASGYAVTLTFESLDSVARAGVVRELAVDLSSEVFALGGRVHLTKNVFAKPAELERMYSAGLAQLKAARSAVDPTGVLGSDFIDRLFPSLT